jgi:hypothetical protein
MKKIHKIAAVPAIAFSALAFIAIAGTPAEAATPSRPGSYCLTYEMGASVCEYATFAQCAATASGIGGQCGLNYSGAEGNASYSPKISRQ